MDGDSSRGFVFSKQSLCANVQGQTLVIKENVWLCVSVNSQQTPANAARLTSNVAFNVGGGGDSIQECL